MLAVTQGDPAGIGPEVTLKGFAPTPRRIHIGDPAIYKNTARFLGMALQFREVASVAEAAALSAEQFAILAPPECSTTTVEYPPPFGQFAPNLAKTTIASIRHACQLAMDGTVQGVVTPPINKAVLHAAGYDFPGHTEMFAKFSGVQQPVMMLTTPGLRVVPATIHQALAEVPKTLDRPLLEQVIRVTWQAMQQDFAIERPRITVTGLNPHAGEAGAFGREELDLIGPVCEQLNGELAGEIRGPLPADSLFHHEARQQYDVVICMYHDQALIPLKMLGFGKAVNLTLGLPIVRSSVDHGTAYNIAGKGIADPTSFLEAIRLAGVIANNRKKYLIANQ